MQPEQIVSTEDLFLSLFLNSVRSSTLIKDPFLAVLRDFKVNCNYQKLAIIICRPFYLPREFTSIIITAVYIPPQADTSVALSKLHDELSGYINKHPDAAAIIAGDFNKANLKKVMPNFHQHISCPTRGQNTLDHCYTQFKNAYKARALPAFGKSDHAAIFLTPEYKQRIVQRPPVEREVTRWSPHSEAMLQASLDDVDWDMFWASSADVSEFTDVAVSFINTLTEQATETVTIRTFSNQKPWVDRSIRDAVNHHTAAYNAGLLSGNMSEYKTSCYALRRAIRAAKRRYRERIESHFQLNDSRRMWQGLKTICSSGNNSSAEVRADPLLAEELNTFYGRFECNVNGGAILPISTSESSRQSSDDFAITFSEDDVRRELKRVNVRKAAGPDGITGRVLKSCADQSCAPPSLLPWTLFSLPTGQIGLLMMPSPRYCTPPSLTSTAKMATMSGCYSSTIAQLSTL